MVSYGKSFVINGNGSFRLIADIHFEFCIARSAIVCAAKIVLAKK